MYSCYWNQCLFTLSVKKSDKRLSMCDKAHSRNSIFTKLSEKVNRKSANVIPPPELLSAYLGAFIAILATVLCSSYNFFFSLSFQATTFMPYKTLETVIIPHLLDLGLELDVASGLFSLALLNWCAGWALSIAGLLIIYANPLIDKDRVAVVRLRSRKALHICNISMSCSKLEV